VCSTVTSPFIAYGLEHQPSSQYMGRVRPAPGWLARSSPIFLFYFFLFFVKKNSKIFVCNFTSFPHIFMLFWLISSNIFHVAKNTKSDIKIPSFRQNFQKKTCFEKRKMFLCIRPSISKLKNHMMFFIKKKQCFWTIFFFNIVTLNWIELNDICFLNI
jgi:hypothetical protein